MRWVERATRHAAQQAAEEPAHHHAAAAAGLLASVQAVPLEVGVQALAAKMMKAQLQPQQQGQQRLS